MDKYKFVVIMIAVPMNIIYLKTYLRNNDEKPYYVTCAKWGIVAVAQWWAVA